MKRGDLYRVRDPSDDPKRSRIFCVVSRQRFIDSRFSTVICAPIYTTRDGLESQVEVGQAEGLKHDSAIHCDVLMSVPKRRLTDHIGDLARNRHVALDTALRVALALE